MGKIIPGEILAQEEVKSSSSDNVYTVILYDNCISCTCPAGGRKTFCKHMNNIVHKNSEAIKNTNFYNDLALFLELKNNKEKNFELLKEFQNRIIYSNKEVANEAFLNSAFFKEERNKKNDIAENIANDIDNIDIHNQFEFFELLCKAYNKKDVGFRYCEYPEYLDEFIKRGYIIEAEKPEKLTDFIKIDLGKKSIYFYKLSSDVKSVVRKLHEILSVKFPKIQVFDDDGIFFTEKRIIDPKYL